MKTLGIRQWLLLGIVIFLGTAAVLYHLAGAFDEGLLQSLRRQQTQQQNAALDVPKPPSEQSLAEQQWLRQIPDDPAGLVRRKFLIEHWLKQRKAQHEDGN